MADTKISAATSTTPQTTDLIPLARSGSAVARQATVAAIVQAQAASTTATGSVELATTAEAQAGASATLAVTPAGLAAYLAQDINIGVDSAVNNKIRFYASGSGDWWTASAQQTFLTHPDEILYYGYNITGAGVRPDTGLHAWYMAFESDYYESPTDHYAEWYIEYISSDGLSSFRPFISQYNLGTSKGTTQIKGRLIIYDSTGAEKILLTDETTASLAIYASTFIRGMVNNVKILEQINAAGDAFVPILKVDSNNRVFIGDTGYNSQTNGNMYFGITTVGPILVDRATSANRRIICTNGVLSTEAE